MNKKKYWIIISILLCVIAALTVAIIVVVNSNKLDINNEVEEKEEEEKGEEVASTPNVELSPTYIALDSEIVKNMYNILNVTPHYVFHRFSGTVLDKENIEDNSVVTVAYYSENLSQKLLERMTQDRGGGGWLSTDDMDSAVKKIFGDISYNHANVYYNDDKYFVLEYNSSENRYIENVGFGGANYEMGYSVITEVAEYEDRYEVKEKFLFGHYYPLEYEVKDYNGSSIAKYSTDEVNQMTQDITGYTDNDVNKKIITKHINDALEYKHTFKKNQDGTFTWDKTEKI